MMDGISLSDVVKRQMRIRYIPARLWRRVARLWRSVACFFRDVRFYLRHGFKRSDTWSLDASLSAWIIPRLRYFRDTHCGSPADLTDEKWTEILSEMLRSFELRKGDGFYLSTDKKMFDEIESGLKLFAEYFLNLWG